MIKIIADSGCDLKTLSHVTDKVAYSRVPLRIIVGDTVFVDRMELDTRNMLDQVYAYKGKTSTACASPGEWAEQFRDADECYVIPISKGVSGSYNSAMIARDIVLAESPEKKIHVFDSLTAGGEMTLMVEETARLAASGMAFEMVCSEVQRYQKRTDLFFLLNSLENFVRNGRVSLAAGMTAKLLNIKVLGCPSSQGELSLLHKCRGKARAYATIMQELRERGFSGGRAIIGHTFNPQGAQELRDTILSEFPSSRITIMPHSGLCGYYSEEGGLLLGFEK